MVSVYSALAQEEPVSISQNQRISYQRRMEQGEFITCKAPFGYRMPDKKNLEIIPEEAETVRWIYESYLNGKSASWLAAELTRRKILTADGKNRWRENVIIYILTNEKYIGDTLCQKKFSEGFPFKKQVNHGEKDQYYIEQTHPAIIPAETFARVRELLRQRAQREIHHHDEYIFTQRIRCGYCGSVFSRRESANGSVKWGCRKHDRNAGDCPAGRVSETAVRETFIYMYNKLRANIDTILQPAITQLETLSEILQRKNPEILAVNRAIAEANEQAYNINRLQSDGLLDADICTGKLRQIAARLLELRRNRRCILQNDDVEDTAAILRETVKKLQKSPEKLDVFNEELFAGLVETITVESETRLRFRLYGGYELTERIREADG